VQFYRRLVRHAYLRPRRLEGARSGLAGCLLFFRFQTIQQRRAIPTLDTHVFIGHHEKMYGFRYDRKS
jgi:hypothetical protein